MPEDPVTAGHLGSRCVALKIESFDWFFTFSPIIIITPFEWTIIWGLKDYVIKAVLKACKSSEKYRSITEDNVHSKKRTAIHNMNNKLK